jgi:hypothetical protein
MTGKIGIPADRFMSVGTVQPQSITFRVGDTWALKITKDGIEGNPDVPADDAAKAILEALKPYLEGLSAMRGG